MVALTIRDVPERVRDALSQDARDRGQSLQAYVLGLLKRQARFTHNSQLIAELERQLADEGGAGPDAPDAADVVNDVRAERRGDENGPSALGDAR
ncbi:MAG: FitA-like ribbon-helix-helix domain-containing protein [Pseudonocardiaceae bacterium]